MKESQKSIFWNRLMTLGNLFSPSVLVIIALIASTQYSETVMVNKSYILFE